MAKRRSLLIAVGAISAIVFCLGFIAKGSSAAQECTSDKCAIVKVNGTKYELKDVAFQKYHILDTVGLPLNTMQIESRFLDTTTPYLINVSGPISEVDKIISKYQIEKSDIQLFPSNTNWISVYGYISKDNLVKLLDQNDANSLHQKSVTILPIGSYELVKGKVVERPSFTTLDEKNEITKEHSKFLETQLSDIVSNDKGVSRLADN